MSKISYTNIAGEKCLCSCTQYEECNTGCSLYRRIAGKQTNADRIRQMSDEELAEFLDAVSKSWYDEGYTKYDESPLMSEYPATASEWIAWLKATVEVDE